MEAVFGAKWDGITLVNLTPHSIPFFQYKAPIQYLFLSLVPQPLFHPFTLQSITFHLSPFVISDAGLCFKNLTSVCYTASVMFFLSAMAALSSKISSRLVKHDLLRLNACWLSLIKLSFEVLSCHIP